MGADCAGKPLPGSRIKRTNLINHIHDVTMVNAAQRGKFRNIAFCDEFQVF